MNNIKLPKNGILTARSALVFYAIIDSSVGKKETIEMPFGTNASTYKNFIIYTQSKDTINIGSVNDGGIKVYRLERLFLELDKFSLSIEEFNIANDKLKKIINKEILIDIMNKLSAKRRGIDWGRINKFINDKGDLSHKNKSNIFLLKKLLKDIVFSVSNVEIPTLTFLDTEKIIEDLPTDGLKASQIEVVLSLKKAFEMLIASKDKIDISFIKSINYEIAKGSAKRAGQIRNHNVIIQGTSYIPPLPTEESFFKFYSDIQAIKDPKERAATYVARATKLQFFSDGNKRSALVVANKLLIDEGQGILIIPDTQRGEYLSLLKAYYENDDVEANLISFIKQFIFKDEEERVNKLLRMKIIDNK